MSMPANYRVTTSHEWVAETQELLVTVGITEHAQAQLGELVFVELPEVGHSITKGQELAVVESVKTAADVYAPVSGEVVAVNDLLENQPQLVNESPYEQGWLFKVKLSSSSELDDLQSAEAYQASL